MPYLDRAGVRLYYEDHGEGLPVLLSHGYGASSAMWAGQIAALADRCRVIIWDMRGHGRSDSPEDPALYSQAAAVADMAAILDACGIAQAVLGGHSLGGYLSLDFYRIWSERVQALMLFGTGPGYRSDEARAEWNRFAEKQARTLEEQGFDALGGAETKIGRHSVLGGLVRAARGILPQADARVMDVLPEVAVPTLIVVGAKDQPYLAAAEYMAEKIPDARKVTIPEAGHAANLHQPERFNAVVRDFLDNLAASQAAAG
jgi:pimeloyl-ACP methyl ester carboxylesterase